MNMVNHEWLRLVTNWRMIIESKENWTTGNMWYSCHKLNNYGSGPSDPNDASQAVPTLHKDPGAYDE